MKVSTTKALTSILIIFTLTACMDPQQKLLDKIKSLGFPDNEIVVTLDDFFEGNNDRASIGPNIHVDQPSPQEFYRELKILKESDKVDDILVRIQDVEGLDWPFTDAIYVISTMTSKEVKEKLKLLQPDEIYADWMYGAPINAPKVQKGYRVYSVWWD